MSTWAERWQQRKVAKRKRKRRRSRDEDRWRTTKSEPEVEPREPFVPSPNPRWWYQFCVERTRAYEERGDPVAAMMYWVLRFIDKEEVGSLSDPCTEDGYRALCDYWAYKQSWIGKVL